MKAGLAVAILRGLGSEHAPKLACAAGAANVTRHGLGSAKEKLLPELAKRVVVEMMAGERR